MKEGPAELFRCCLQTSALSKSTEGLAQEPRSRRGLVLKHDKAIIDLPDRENSTKKKHKGQGRERGGTCHGEAKDRLPEEWARIQITQMQNPSVLVNLD